MFKYFSNTKNKHPRRQEVAYQDYIYAERQSSNRINDNAIRDVEIELARNIYDMRREYKRTVKRMKGLYIDWQPKQLKHEIASLTKPGLVKRAVAS